MKKTQLIKVCFVTTLLFLTVAPTKVSADTKTSTAEVTITGGPFVAEPTAPPSQLPAGNIVLPTNPVNSSVGQSTHNPEASNNNRGIGGNLLTVAENVFPKTGSEMNFWLLVIGLELILLTLLLHLLKKQTDEQKSLGGNADV